MSARHRPPRQLAARLLRRWLRVVARVVPPAARPAWREEWDGELRIRPRRGFGWRRTGDLAIGMTRDALDVRRSARAVSFRGGPRQRMSVRFESWTRNLRHAWRRTRRSPVTAFGVAGTLALGVGANTAIFAVADTVLLKPLPYPHADRLVAVWESGPQQTAARTRVSVPDFLDWRDRAVVFDDLAAHGNADLNVIVGGRAIRVRGQVVSANFFRMLGASPAIGRDFLPHEESEGRGSIAVVSHTFWRRELGGDPSVIGRSLSIDGVSHTIAGVMPADFRSPGQDGAAVWLPLGRYGGNLRIWRATHVLAVIGRLHPDWQPRVAESYLADLAQELWERAPLWNGWTVTVRPLRTEMYGDFRRSAGFLWAAGLALLAVMSANLANLFLADGIGRRAEFAVRRALGASKRTLLGQVAFEIGILAILAIIMGLGLAVIITDTLILSLPAAVTAVYSLAVDVRAATYAVAIALASTLLFGFVPALGLAGSEDRSGDGQLGRPGHARGSRRLQSGLVAGQVALSLALLVITLLAADSQRRLRRVDPGFHTERVASFRVALAGPDYDAPNARRSFFQRVERQVAGIPGVSEVGMGSHVPFVGATRGSGASVWVVGRPPEPGAEQPLADVNFVSPGFLATLDIEVTRGRGLRDGDDADAAPVAMVNRTAAAMLWPGSDPLGTRIRTGVTAGTELDVVGVVEDVRLTDLRRPASPQVYVAGAQFPPAGQTFAVRSNQPFETLAGPLRRAVAAVDPTQPLYDAAPLQTYLDRSLAGSFLLTKVFSALALLAGALAAVGIYAVVSFTVGTRTREFSVRQALGARATDVSRLVLREAAIVVCIGLAAGGVLAVLAARVVANQLYGVSPLDPSIYLLGAATLGLLAIGSALVPARRAARVPLAETLRGS